MSECFFVFFLIFFFFKFSMLKRLNTNHHDVTFDDKMWVDVQHVILSNITLSNITGKKGRAC